MKTVWIGKTGNQKMKASLRTLAHRLLVDVVPTLLLLAAMAYAMTVVSHQITTTYNAEPQTGAKKLS